MAGTAAAIKATLGLDTTPLESGLTRATASTQGFASKLKQVMSGAAGLFGARAIISQVDSIVQGFKEMVEKVELSEDAVQSLKREMAGLSKEQAEELSKLPSLFESASSAASGFFGKLILGLRAAKNGGGLVGLVRPFEVEQEEQKIGLTTQEQAMLNKRQGEIEKKRAEEEKKLRESVAKIDEDIVDKQQRAAEQQMSIAERIAETERKITEAKAGQVGQADELIAAELRRKQAVEEITLSEQKRQQIKERADAILAGPDAARESRRGAGDRERAENRAARELDLKARGGLSKDDFARAQRLKKQTAPAGELQGPPAPGIRNEPATEATMKGIHDVLKRIAPKLGVNV